MTNNFRMRKYLARVLLPILTIWLCVMPGRAYAFGGLVAPLVVRMGGTATLAYGVEVSTWLHAAVLSMTFDTSSATGGTSTQASTGALTVSLNPKSPVPTPAGWTAPAAGQIQPAPPSTATSQGTTLYRLGSTGATGTTASAACVANHGVWNSYFGRCDSVPYADCTAAGFTNCPAYANLTIGTVTTYACPAGYTVNGSTCNLSDATVVRKPADSQCQMVRNTTAGTFAPDSTDPDCDNVVANSNNGTAVPIGAAAKGLFYDKSITITRDDGTQTTYQLLNTGGGQVQYLHYDATSNTTQYVTAQFSAPAVDGTTTLDGYSQSTLPGGGSLSGAAPSGGISSTGGSMTSGAVGTTSGGTGGATFPSDYARSGEATSAANGLGTKLDSLHGDLSNTTNTTDPTEPTVANMPGWGNTFTNLVSWQLPAHSSACPTPSLDLSNVLGAGKVFSFDAHCTLINNHFQALNAAMTVVWSMLALFIVLRA